MNDNNELIQAEIDTALALERQLNQQVAAIKAAQEQIDASWSAVKESMREHNIKSIKGDFGSITIAERTSFKVDESVLPDEFFKRAPDTKKIGNEYALTGEPPEGVTPQTTQFLTKRLKG